MSDPHPEGVRQGRLDDVLKTSLYGSISKPKKRPRYKDLAFGLSINECYITKMASTAQQLDNTKGRNMNYVSKLNNKTYVFLSTKMFSNSVYLSLI